MSQLVRSLLAAAALLVHASSSFAEPAPAAGTVQLPKILVSTFEPVKDPESGGIFAIRCGVGVESKDSAISMNAY